jgi:hypothetical protein
MKHFIKSFCFYSNEVKIRYLPAEIAQLVLRLATRSEVESW